MDNLLEDKVKSGGVRDDKGGRVPSEVPKLCIAADECRMSFFVSDPRSSLQEIHQDGPCLQLVLDSTMRASGEVARCCLSSLEGYSVSLGPGTMRKWFFIMLNEGLEL
jgi:hypothetical protein